MPNGVSCAYFAVKNFEYGKQNKDIFRDGIAGAQTTRTVDTLVKTTNAASPAAKVIGKAASIAKKNRLSPHYFVWHQNYRKIG